MPRLGPMVIDSTTSGQCYLIAPQFIRKLGSEALG